MQYLNLKVLRPHYMFFVSLKVSRSAGAARSSSRLARLWLTMTRCVVQGTTYDNPAVCKYTGNKYYRQARVYSPILLCLLLSLGHLVGG